MNTRFAGSTGIPRSLFVVTLGCLLAGSLLSGAAAGTSASDTDNDGMEDSVDPYPEDPRNLCFGAVATDGSAESAIRINSGPFGGLTDCNGDAWSADFGHHPVPGNTFFNLGQRIAGIDAIFGCSDLATEDLFQSERWDPPLSPELSYLFDLPNGTYLVNLYFANLFYGTTFPGSRLFDIYMEGTLVYDDFDQILASGGPYSAVVRSAVVSVSDGDGLEIELGHVIENPKIAALEVLSQGGLPVPDACALAIQLDIKPDSYPNSINPFHRGVIPVAILGSDSFDVTTIDLVTLTFGPGRARLAHNLNSPFTYSEHLEDVNLDGFTDLLAHFRAQDTGITCGDESGALTGQTLDGQALEGSDSVRTVGCFSRRGMGRQRWRTAEEPE